MNQPELPLAVATLTAPDTPSGLVSTQEMARHYGVAVSTFLEWFHSGIVPAAVAVGKTYRFDREEVAQAIAKHTTKQNRSNRAKPARTAPAFVFSAATLAR